MFPKQSFTVPPHAPEVVTIQGPGRTGLGDEDAPEILKSSRIEAGHKINRNCVRKWESRDRRRPAMIHRGVTTKTTLDTAKPACLLSNRQSPPLFISLPLLTTARSSPGPPIFNFLSGFLRLGSFLYLDLARRSQFLAIHIPDRRVKPVRHS